MAKGANTLRIVLAFFAFLVISQPAAAKAEVHSPRPRHAAEASPDGEAEEVAIRLFRRHGDLEMELFPAKGVAVVHTFESRPHRVWRSVAYAVSVPAKPFRGPLDVDFPGLGRIVGTVSQEDPLGPAAQRKVCEELNPYESARFEGHLAFRGAGGYGRWASTAATADIRLACGRKFRRETAATALFDHVAEFDLTLNGPALLRLGAEGEVGPYRSARFFAWGDSRRFEFDASVREWLPGGIATLRWVKKEGAPGKTVAIRSDSMGPVSARLTPPAPFFGEGTYRRSTGDLTGSIGVNFPGLKLRLTQSPSPLVFEDEEDLRRSRAIDPTYLSDGPDWPMAPTWSNPLRQ